MPNNVYLIAAIIGAVVPILFFVGVFHDAPIGVTTFVPQIFANAGAGGLAADILIASFVFWMYMFGRSEGPKPWLFIALNLGIGLSCALPAYIYASRLQSQTGAPRVA